ncbi:MAG: response regulator [Gemmataceae bacterium]|nr:response regulator [Gemmataceae bacterium]MDW8267485.1 response regulator [Gemmataceae bacterium]
MPTALTRDKDPGGWHSTAHIRILVLDDDPAVCRLIQSTLAEEDFGVDTVSDPGQMESALQNPAGYHVIILDYVVPGLNSDQLLAWVKQYQPDASIIVVTAYPSVDSALSCLRAHAHDYITKPFQIEHLRRVVVRCLEEKGLLRLSEEALRETLGATIRERRKALGLTLAQLSDRTGLSLGYLSQIELGKNSASIETLYRISLGLGVKLADLFHAVQTKM